MPASKEYFQEYYLTRKRKLFVIMGGENYSCNQCEYFADDLEFDHVDPETKLFSIGSCIMQGWSGGKYEALLEELGKCQLLCPAHHLVKTRIQLAQERGWAHGTMYSWMEKRCTCELCASAKRSYQDARNAERRIARNGSRGPYGLPAGHGTYKRYKRGCRCSDCKASNAQHTRDLRAEKLAS